MAVLGFVPDWWTWRVSAQARGASLALLWALLFAAPVLGLLALPVLVVRLVLSSVQMAFNSALGRQDPLERRTRADWLLFALTFLLACVASEAGKTIGHPHSPLLLGAVALPYTGIQLRALGRTRRAADRIEATLRARIAAPARVGGQIYLRLAN